MCPRVADTVGSMTNDTPHPVPHCCEIGCDKPAEFRVHPDGLKFADSFSDACREHVGEMLGWPDWDAKQSPHWNVSAIPAPV